MIVRIYTDDERLKRVAQKAIRFVTATLLDSFLDSIRVVIVFDRSSIDRAASDARTIDDYVAKNVEDFKYESIRGRYIEYDGKAIAAIIDGAKPNYIFLKTVAHEFGHASMHDHIYRLCEKFLLDIPDLDEALSKALMHAKAYGYQDLRNEIFDVMDCLVWRVASEIAADYISINYYVFLNTEPRLDINKAIELTAKMGYMYYELFRPIYIRITSDLFYSVLSDLSKVVNRSKLPDTVKSEISSHIRRAEMAILEGRVTYGKTIEFIHSTFMSNIRRKPKDVFIENRDEYEEVLEGLDINRLRADGVPFMDR